MQCEFINPLIEPQWNSWILEHPDATIFHSAQWAAVLAESYGYRPVYAVFKEEKRRIGILPIMEVRSVWTGHRGVCLPFSDMCTPLLADGVRLTGLLEPVRSFGLKNGWDYLELRGADDLGPSAKQSNEFVTHHLAIDSNEGILLSKLRDSTRRNIQKALREGVEIQHLRTRDAIDVFYSLHCRTRRRHGLPPQPLRFFHLIHKLLIERGFGFVSLARAGQKWIAGAVYFRFGSQSLYKFGASDTRFQHLRANNLLMWQAIGELQKEGATGLSLGRSDPLDAGLLQFKRGWGGRETRLPYHRIKLLKEPGAADSSKKNPISGPSHKIVRLLPLWVLRLAGKVLYRHLG